MHRSERHSESKGPLTLDIKPKTVKRVNSARASIVAMPESPAYYSHTDVKTASKRLPGGSMKNRLFDGASREIDYVN